MSHSILSRCGTFFAVEFQLLVLSTSPKIIRIHCPASTSYGSKPKWIGFSFLRIHHQRTKFLIHPVVLYFCTKTVKRMQPKSNPGGGNIDQMYASIKSKPINVTGLAANIFSEILLVGGGTKQNHGSWKLHLSMY